MRLLFTLAEPAELLATLTQKYKSVAAITRWETPQPAIEIIFFDGEDDEIEAVRAELYGAPPLRPSLLPGGAQRAPSAPEADRPRIVEERPKGKKGKPR